MRDIFVFVLNGLDYIRIAFTFWIWIFPAGINFLAGFLLSSRYFTHFYTKNCMFEKTFFMKKLTQDQSKIDLVAKLVKDGAIDFVDALKLLEVEVEKEYITVPYQQNDWFKRPQIPFWEQPYVQNPYIVTCEMPKGAATTANLLSFSN